MKTKILQAVCLIAASVSASTANSEIISIDGGAYAVNESEATPRRGEGSAEVIKRFGEPVHRHRPVGTPAITSWEYQGFAVYFENGIVIHSVITAP